jgi:hypothetical protein
VYDVALVVAGRHNNRSRRGVALRSVVAGALVSRECFSCTGHLATLFCVYDSLIEKCSTVSGSERQRDPQCLLLV